MDKKAKKRIDVLNQRLRKLRQQLSGHKQQNDDPEELARIEREIADAQTELTELKAS